MGCISKTAPAVDSRNSRGHDYGYRSVAQGKELLNLTAVSACWTRHPSLGSGERRNRSRLQRESAIFSALEWSPFWPSRSRLFSIFSPAGSARNTNVLARKNRALDPRWTRHRNSHSFDPETDQDCDPPGNPQSLVVTAISARATLDADPHRTGPLRCGKRTPSERQPAGGAV